MIRKSKNIRRIVWTVMCLSVAGWGYAWIQIMQGNRAEQAALKQWDLKHAIPEAAAPTLSHMFEQSRSTVLSGGLLPDVEEVSPASSFPAQEEALGVLYLPKADRRIPLFAGTDAAILKKGAGLDPAAALPGKPGNSVISGHRDTVFRILSRIRPGDEIQVETDAGVFTYTVETTEIVKETEAFSFQEEKDSVLRLVTCYPFYYVGPAPERFIATARLKPQENEYHF